jgi:hypothetical protein
MKRAPYRALEIPARVGSRRMQIGTSACGRLRPEFEGRLRKYAEPTDPGLRGIPPTRRSGAHGVDLRGARSGTRASMLTRRRTDRPSGTQGHALRSECFLQDAECTRSEAMETNQFSFALTGEVFQPGHPDGSECSCRGCTDLGEVASSHMPRLQVGGLTAPIASPRPGVRGRCETTISGRRKCHPA